MTFKYRCMRCRCRNTFKRRLRDYIRVKRCKACGHTRFYWDKERNGRRDICGCQGYWFVHRRGSRFCQHNPMHEVWERERAGEDRTEVFIEATLDGRIPGDAEWR